MMFDLFFVKKGVLILCTYFALVNSAAALEKNALDILLKVRQQNTMHKSQKYSIKMTVVGKDKQPKVRSFDWNHLYDKDENYSLIEFPQSSFSRGEKLLSIEDKDVAKVSQWIYLPAFHSIRIIDEDERAGAFMNSHFTYEDITGRSPFKDNHRLMSWDESYYYITSTPKDARAGDYTQIKMVVDRKNYVAVKVEFFGANRKKIKTLVNSQIVNVENMYIATHLEMIDHMTSGKTLLEIESASVEEKFSKNLFSIKSLQ